MFGTRMPRSEDQRILTGEGRYVAAVKLPDAAHVAFVRSTMAHALIDGVDTSEAGGMPGVLAVLTGDDIPITASWVPAPPAFNRPVLASERVRFVGEAIVAIVAETAAQAVDAAETVVVELSPLPAVVDPTEALQDEVLVHEAAGTNVLHRIETEDAGALDEAEVVVTKTYRFPRIAPAPLEPRATAAEWQDGRLTFYAATQGPTNVKGYLARSLDVDPASVRIVAGDVGGSFGAKGLIGEMIVTAWAARELGRPVRWVETRTESMLTMPHGRAQTARVSLGATRDGRFTGLKVDLVQDSGAYPDLSMFLPRLTKLMAVGTYAIPRLDWSGVIVATNTTPVGAFRGAGRPEASYFLERIVDVMAAELGIDPVELRRRNVIPSDHFPYNTPAHANYDSGRYGEALERLVVESGYDALRAEQRRRREQKDHRQLGIGVAMYIEITNVSGSSDPARVEVHDDGMVDVTSSAMGMGQGTETSWKMIVSDRLGVPPEHVRVFMGDTDRMDGPGSGGSKTLQSAGVAIWRASESLVGMAKEVAAKALEADVDDIVFDVDNAEFHVAGVPSSAIGWPTIAREAGGHLGVEEVHDFQAEFPYGVDLCVVEVDIETGRVELERVVALDDVGRVLNPMLVEGQLHGGLAHGIAFALLEEVRFDEIGNPVTTNFMDYGLVSAPELVSFELIPFETPTPLTELGTKGAGESGAIGSTGAVVNAVLDALAPYGVRDVDPPLSALNVWAALASASASA
jgi:carbon-monoxide dehydrogenase large subunit